MSKFYKAIGAEFCFCQEATELLPVLGSQVRNRYKLMLLLFLGPPCYVLKKKFILDPVCVSM